ncbi:hypothetical protein [Nocardioides bruguierae]|uniref:hypothetical protein n=1 Tax=Nocardioides bruguierae TaxID=2945102 RepID=UPI002020F0BA|nr:hypothetical protein [Nocardioides bruguierae]MCL8025622.1 hypothetical protein [Nocardioides bruguierae]
MTATSHRRGEILRAVIAAADHRCDGLLPTDVPGVRAATHPAFADDLDLLGALQLRWHARLAGRIEREQSAGRSAGHRTLADAVVAAWRATADEMPGVRLVLDRAATAPTDERTAAAFARARAKEHATLAVAAGLAGTSDAEDPRALAAGERLEEAARLGWTPAPRRPVGQRRTLVDRLRAVLAA